MGRLVGYMVNCADWLVDVLYQEWVMVSAYLSTGLSGWGVGFY